MPSPTRRALLAAALALPATARASLPTRPVRWIVGFPPGAGPDLLTRLLVPLLQPALGQPIVVENRPGAAGNLAAAALARAAPDGTTFGTLFAANLAVNRHLYATLGYDPARDFTLVSEFARFPGVILAHPSVPASNLAQLGDWIRAQPRPPLWATGGAGVIPHLATELLLRRLEANAELIHYRGSADALLDLAAGRVPVAADGFPTGLPLVRDGRAKAIAMTGAVRSPLAPGLPAVAETLPGFEAASWIAAAAPAGLPRDLAERVEAAVTAACADPALRERFAGLGVEPIGEGPQALAARAAAEDARWGEVIRVAGIRVE
ncbi:Bug family tripartite tricarboxylate transporter substrate binding protein [Falsiroseomonas sp. HW251]|uniref:Bug family tripartite tricarboxylate transporter substrate binding protein n=1 Tax=Falsiroseomonas sp. HW251 TaxID=3390998 RepID=UPI003D317EBD